MRAAMQQMNLSARAYHRVLKLAGSPPGAIADLAGEGEIGVAHLAVDGGVTNILSIAFPNAS